jgi:hypothetical protein
MNLSSGTYKVCSFVGLTIYGLQCITYVQDPMQYGSNITTILNIHYIWVAARQPLWGGGGSNLPPPFLPPSHITIFFFFSFLSLSSCPMHNHRGRPMMSHMLPSLLLTTNNQKSYDC